MRFYLTERRAELNVVQHILCPGLAVLILLAPLYYQFVPWPVYPGNWGDGAAIVFVLLALGGAMFASRPRPAHAATPAAESVVGRDVLGTRMVAATEEV
jgi:hypothetical protein